MPPQLRQEVPHLTSYSTEYESQQEEECEDNYKKDCDISYSPQAQNVTIRVCMTPLVKVSTAFQIVQFMQTLVFNSNFPFFTWDLKQKAVGNKNYLRGSIIMAEFKVCKLFRITANWMGNS